MKDDAIELPGCVWHVLQVLHEAQKRGVPSLGLRDIAAALHLRGCPLEMAEEIASGSLVLLEDFGFVDRAPESTGAHRRESKKWQQRNVITSARRGLTCRTGKRKPTSG